MGVWRAATLGMPAETVAQNMIAAAVRVRRSAPLRMSRSDLTRSRRGGEPLLDFGCGPGFEAVEMTQPGWTRARLVRSAVGPSARPPSVFDRSLLASRVPRRGARPMAVNVQDRRRAHGPRQGAEQDDRGRFERLVPEREPVHVRKARCGADPEASADREPSDA